MQRIAMFLLVSLFLIGLLAPVPTIAQEFDTGSIGVELEQYGAIIFYAPSLYSVMQIERTSILVGVSETAVFDYWNDAGVEDPPINVPSPQHSDYELYGAINNDWSGLPPEVLVRINIYGWVGGGYCIVKFTVINREVDPIDAIIGMEILPIIDGIYGDEVVEWLASEQVIAAYKPTSYVGYEWLSADLISLKSFEWYLGYNLNDADLWDWLNYGQFDLVYQSGADGAVSIPAQASVSIASGDSVIVYFAMAYGNSQAEMLSNIAAAEDAFLILEVRNEGSAARPLTFNLEQNYPNPFNSSTLIRFQLPSRETVLLNVYDEMGRNVATLVDAELQPGAYAVDFNAAHLPSGVYIYKLQAGPFVDTRKMVLIK